MDDKSSATKDEAGVTTLAVTSVATVMSFSAMIFTHWAYKRIFKREKKK